MSGVVRCGAARLWLGEPNDAGSSFRIEMARKKHSRGDYRTFVNRKQPFWHTTTAVRCGRSNRVQSPLIRTLNRSGERVLSAIQFKVDPVFFGVVLKRSNLCCVAGAPFGARASRRTTAPRGGCRRAPASSASTSSKFSRTGCPSAR